MSQAATHGLPWPQPPGLALGPMGRLTPTPTHQRHVVALGGGHGLSATLSALPLLVPIALVLMRRLQAGGVQL